MQTLCERHLQNANYQKFEVTLRKTRNNWGGKVQNKTGWNKLSIRFGKMLSAISAPVLCLVC